VANVATTGVLDSRTTTESNTTMNRLGERAVGVIQNTTINNTFTTINDITNVTEITQVTNVVNNTNVTQVTNNITEVTNVTQVRAPDPAPPPVIIAPDFPELEQPNPRPQGRGREPDPIAQTFFVSDMPFGCYVTSLDIFFKKKSLTNSVTLQLRDVVNGYPGNKVIPFGEVTLNPNQVEVDAENAATSTKFSFPSPVYLQNNTEYCFVLLPAGNDPNYEIWVSELGENQLNTTTRISEQPNTGVLFTSANNRTWSAFQAEDIKFLLNRADFEVGTTGNVILETLDIDYAKFDSFSGSAFASGDRIHGFSFDIVDGGSGYTPTNGTISRTLSGGIGTGGTNATVDVTIAAGVVTNVIVTNPGAGYTSNPTLTLTGGTGADIDVTLNVGYVHNYDSLYNVSKILVDRGAFAAEDVVGNGTSYGEIVELEDKVLNALGANIGYLNHTPCQLIWAYSATTNVGSETQASSSYVNFVPDKTTELTFDAAIRSYSNEQADLDGDKSFKIQLGMSTQTSTVSPVVDLRKCSMVVVANDINNDATDEDIGIGDARSKYVSRQVVLDDGQEAEDLKVYLSQKMPAGTDVKVYGKFLHQSDPAAFEDKEWIELVTTPPTVTSSSFVEYSYDIPSTELNGGVFEYTTDGVTYTGYKTFAVKVVLLSSQTSVVPKCRELRAIALQA
jgi:hypothetical protein